MPHRTYERVREEVGGVHLLGVRRERDRGSLRDVTVVEADAAAGNDARKEVRGAETERLLNDTLENRQLRELIRVHVLAAVWERLLDLGTEGLPVMGFCGQEVDGERHGDRGVVGALSWLL